MFIGENPKKVVNLVTPILDVYREVYKRAFEKISSQVSAKNLTYTKNFTLITTTSGTTTGTTGSIEAHRLGSSTYKDSNDPCLPVSGSDAPEPAPTEYNMANTASASYSHRASLTQPRETDRLTDVLAQVGNRSNRTASGLFTQGAHPHPNPQSIRSMSVCWFPFFSTVHSTPHHFVLSYFSHSTPSTPSSPLSTFFCHTSNGVDSLRA